MVRGWFLACREASAVAQEAPAWCCLTQVASERFCSNHKYLRVFACLISFRHVLSTAWFAFVSHDRGETLTLMERIKFPVALYTAPSSVAPHSSWYSPLITHECVPGRAQVKSTDTAKTAHAWIYRIQCPSHHNSQPGPPTTDLISRCSKNQPATPEQTQQERFSTWNEKAPTAATAV